MSKILSEINSFGQGLVLEQLITNDSIVCSNHEQYFPGSKLMGVATGIILDATLLSSALNYIPGRDDKWSEICMYGLGTRLLMLAVAAIPRRKRN